jgi:hypothetical protein
VSLIPKSLFHPFSVKQSEKLLLNRRKEASRTVDFDDIDLILNSD